MNRFRLHPRRTAPRRGESGFTLVEALVAVAIIGIIIVPLSYAFIASFRISDVAAKTLNASANRDSLAEYFSKDVARVDAAGVSTDETKSCDIPGGGGGTLHVTFNASRVNNGNPVTDRVSYWITGSGTNLDIVRRSCLNVPAGTRSYTGTQVTVADDIAGSGATAENTVRGIYKPPDPDPSSNTYLPCTEFVCGIDILGAYPMQVTAQRRVFGAGVPLESGKIYSSSFTRGLSLGQAYDLYDVNGNSVGKEARFTDQLTLGAGLDGPTDLTVKFAVKQVETGKWLVNPANPPGGVDAELLPSDPSTLRFQGSSEFYMNGEYKDGRWRLPLRLSADDAMNFAGEYRVWTWIDPAVAYAPNKFYGGSSGFPLWIDWRRQESVFVDAASGNDSNSGLSRSEPLKTIAKGFEKATAAQRIYVIATNKQFNESVNISGANYGNNKVAVGNHDPNNWLRGPAPSSADGAGTKIVGTAGFGVRVDGKSRIRFRQVSIDSGNAPANSGLPGANGNSTYGVLLTAPDVATEGDLRQAIFEWSYIGARNGANGVGGASPAKRGDACWGVKGSVPGGATTWLKKSDDAPCNASGIRAAGAGGNGGGVGLGYDEGKSGGGAASRPGYIAGAPGGAGGKNTLVPCVASAFANPGWGASTPPAAGFGAGGQLIFDNSAQASGWVPPIAPAATSGDVGGGGGGGGGGLGCTLGFDPGGGGASGGQGGMGGHAGGNGGAGGGSFGVYATGGIRPWLIESPVRAGNGGRGGDGGKGGDGGNGGVGGPAIYSGAGLQDRGGAGGGGGSGGSGGGGGAPGAGGPSIGIYSKTWGQRIDGAAPVRGTAGANGARGLKGRGGLGGPGGSSTNYPTEFLGIELWSINTSGGIDGFAGRDGTDSQTVVFAVPQCNYWSGEIIGGVPQCNPS